MNAHRKRRMQVAPKKSARRRRGMQGIPAALSCGMQWRHFVGLMGTYSTKLTLLPSTNASCRRTKREEDAPRRCYAPTSLVGAKRSARAVEGIRATRYGLLRGCGQSHRFWLRWATVVFGQFKFGKKKQGSHVSTLTCRILQFTLGLTVKEHCPIDAVAIAPYSVIEMCWKSYSRTDYGVCYKKILVKKFM